MLNMMTPTRWPPQIRARKDAQTDLREAPSAPETADLRMLFARITTGSGAAPPSPYAFPDPSYLRSTRFRMRILEDRRTSSIAFQT